MGKNKKSVFSVLDTRNGQNIQVDSVEEVEFYLFCLECQRLGLILDFIYQPVSWVLSDKQTYISLLDKIVQKNKKKNKKCKEKFLIAEHIYTPDFKLTLNSEYIETFGTYLKLPSTQIDKNGNPYVYLDIKGTFQRFGGDRSFSLNVKWVYQKYGIYVQKVIPKDAFLKLGVCKELLYTQKTKKPSKKYAGFPSIKSKFKLS